jgi:ATP-binding cassette subfamily B protein
MSPTAGPRHSDVRGAASRWRNFRDLLGDRLSSVVILSVASILSALAEAGILAIAAQVATDLVSGKRRITTSLGLVTFHTTVTSLLLVALVIAAIRLLLQGPIAYYPARIVSEVQARMRRELFDAFSAAAWDTKSADREGHFQEVITNQVLQASQGALNAPTLIVSGVTFLILAATAFALNVVAALIVLGAAILLFLALRRLSALGWRLSGEFSSAQMDYAGVINEANSVAEETQVFGTASAQRERVDRSITIVRDLVRRVQFVGRVIPGIYQSAIYVVLIVGLILIDEAHVGGISSLGAVILILVRTGSYGQQAQVSYQAMRQAMPFVDRVRVATERYRAGEGEFGALQLEPVKTLAFEGVSYAYQSDRPVLAGLTFEVRGGETIGVVGPSGAGKSTLVQILLRLRPPHDGRYLINGKSVVEYLPQDWNRQVVYVPQQPRLVFASVADNVRFFRPIDDEAVERACRLAQIHDEIVTWPHGYETIVGPRAEAVSGGQQQRICLARAIVAKPEVLVLDEPTSALDPRSEALIQESLQALKHRMTLFIVAHRMSTLTICDRVMVIVDGKLTAFDTLDALHSSNEYFQVASAIAGISSRQETAAAAADAAVTPLMSRFKLRRYRASRG